MQRLKIILSLHLWLLLISNLELINCGSTYDISPPFDKFKPGTGERQASSAWISKEATSVYKNFVRLTSDLPDQTGRFLGLQSFLLEKNKKTIIDIKFRVSGKGKQMFGDGLAFWLLTNKNNPNRNPFLAVNEDSSSIYSWTLGGEAKFTGFGVLFDTYKNTAKDFFHQDISLVQNDGTRRLDSSDFERQRPSCMGGFRYHEGKDSFSPLTDHSKARIEIIFEDNIEVKLFVDKKGKKYFGESFDRCFSATLDEDVYQSFATTKSFFALTAKTGGLADNHDLLGFNMSVVEIKENTRKKRRKKYEDETKEVEEEPTVVLTEVEMEFKERIDRIESSIERLEHEFEHKLASIDSNLKSLIRQLEDEEVKQGDRIKKLEKRNTKTLENRLKAIESSNLKQGNCFAENVAVEKDFEDEFEIQEKDNTIEALKKAVKKLRKEKRELVHDFEKKLKEKEKDHTTEMERSVTKHLAFIDKLLKDKKTLAADLKKASGKMRQQQTAFEQRLKETHDDYNAKMENIRIDLTKSEGQRRKVWEEVKTKEIKRSTVKGLEVELQKLLDKHKKELMDCEEKFKMKWKEKEIELLEKQQEKINDKCKYLEKEKLAAVEAQKKMDYLNWEKKLEKSTAELKKRLQEYKHKLKKLKKQKEHAQDASKLTLSARLDEERSRQKEQLEALKQKHDEEKVIWEKEKLEVVTKIQKQSDGELEQRIQEVKHKVTELANHTRDEQISKILEKLQKEKSLEMKLALEDLEKQRCRDREEDSAKIADAKKREILMREKMDDMIINLKKVKAELQDAKADEHTLKECIQRKKQKLDVLKSENINLQSKVHEKVNSATSPLRRELEKLRRDYESLEHARDEAIFRLKKQEKLAEARLQKEVVMLEERLKRVLLRKDEEIASLRKQILVKNKQVVRAEKLLQTQREELLQLK
eukprot:augustus_masked-scaffold_14-processed-gene-5.3-mRNA-1 protein AED:1.00 eAED:1.00 QI:0/0/0/0/1/1/2/0/927